MRIGIMTGGGDCPGLNAVIRAVVRKGASAYNDEFLGFLDSWDGVMEQRYIALQESDVRGLLPRGGTILGTRRGSPYDSSDGVDRVKKCFADQRLDGLIVIGAARHLGGEEGHHLGEVHGAVSLVQHKESTLPEQIIFIRYIYFNLYNNQNYNQGSLLENQSLLPEPNHTYLYRLVPYLGHWLKTTQVIPMIPCHSPFNLSSLMSCFLT